jgi:hypothetical protein
MEKQNVKNEVGTSELKNSIISHLTCEISTITTLRNSWRTQVMSLIYIGPFLLVSSIFFGDKEIPTGFHLSRFHWILITTAFICWILLGLVAGLVEYGIWKKCNEWRKLILKIISNEFDITKVSEKSFLHVQRNPPIYISYFIVYILLGTILFCIVYLIVDIFFR